MKELRLIFAVLLAPLVFHGAIADDATDTARAATRRGTSTTLQSNRQKTINTETKSIPTTTVSRSTNVAKNTTVRERTTSATTTPRDGNVVRDTARATTSTTDNKSISARTGANVQSRATTSTKSAISSNVRSAISGLTRTATQSRAATTNTSASRTPMRTIATARTRAARSATMARNADGDTTDTTALRDQVLTRNYSKCRTVFNDCMDEFCANKDAQLGRCACSSRVNEFESTKKRLANVEDKLLDFSQRLLTVNLDKEDAMAINQATEGELAYATKDTSESKKMLDEIAKKLNTSFNNSNFDQQLNAISLSLDADSAFDSIDSLAGASTTTKTGTALYAAALPVCREMALEVCSQDELNIAESGYQMMIEQACNTVKKSYQTQADSAREQIRESSALLDMSRLDIHQKRNSDDILTCKSKMLDMLSDSTVCGDGLGKCLDTSGRYIDPSTGEAFLSLNLADLATLITRPTGDQTWTNAPGNDRFVSYLNSKKTYLEPAMENCQDIADYVWDEFIDDALAQIKLAQESKLEEVRQSCTTLVAQCLDETADSIADFDARALSTFGVSADKTVNAMCAEVNQSCTALMDATGGGATDWQSGMTNIATDKTYDTIIQTCREVGRSCIIQACKSISGNFGLCEDIDTSVNRKAIINRTSCWNEVLDCVASAGETSLANIQTQHPLTEYTPAATTDADSETGNSDTAATPTGPTYAFYLDMYGITSEDQITRPTNTPQRTAHCATTENTNCVYDICAEDGQCSSDTSKPVSTECYTCRLAEKIWGNCEVAPTTDLADSKAHNQIKITSGDTDNTGTLLSWFAKNTGTIDVIDNCRDTTCPQGFTNVCTDIKDSEGNITGKACSCTFSEDTDDTQQKCPTNLINSGKLQKIEVFDDLSICCASNATDTWGNCCQNSTQWNDLPDSSLGAKKQLSNTNLYYGPLDTTKPNICVSSSSDSANYITSFTVNSAKYKLICVGSIQTNADDDDASDNFRQGKKIICNGTYVLMDANNDYLSISSKMTPVATSQTENKVIMWYRTANETNCKYNGNVWEICNDNKTCTVPSKKFISYQEIGVCPVGTRA